MPTQIDLPVGPIRVDPGGSAFVEAVVCNVGSVEELVSFEILGTASTWTTLDPPMLRLPFGGTAPVRIHFHPPRAPHVRPGATPFGILAVSDDGRGGHAIAEEQLVIGRFVSIETELFPEVREGRASTFRLTVRNRGNSTEHCTIAGRDADDRLRVLCSPPGVSVYPDSDVTCRIRVRVARRRCIGGLEPRSFQVIVRPADSDPIVLNGTLIDSPFIVHKPVHR